MEAAGWRGGWGLVPLTQLLHQSPVFFLGLVGEEHLNDAVQLTPVELTQTHKPIDELYLLQAENNSRCVNWSKTGWCRDASRRSRVGVGMNRSVRGGKKCEEL